MALQHYTPSRLLLQVKMTLLLALVSVPINTVWGIVAAIQITRNEFPGKTFAMAMLDLPFSISPVVTGKQCLHAEHMLSPQADAPYLDVPVHDCQWVLKDP